MNPVIIDVREPAEFMVSHAEGALNIPLDSIASGIPQELEQLPKDQPVIVYCMSGQRAGRAKAMLEQYDFQDVTNGINESMVSDR